jgi:hypothetical protein
MRLLLVYGATCYLFAACSGSGDSKNDGPDNGGAPAGFAGARAANGGRDAMGNPSPAGSGASNGGGEALGSHSGLVRLNLKVK